MKNNRNKIFSLAVFVLCITVFGLVTAASAGTLVTTKLIDASNLTGSTAPVKALLRIPTEDVPDFCNGDLYIGITNFSFNGPNPRFMYVKIVQTNISNFPVCDLQDTGNGLQIKMGSGLKLDDHSDGYRQVKNYTDNIIVPRGDLGDNADINFANDTLMIVINESAWVRAGIDTSTNTDDVIIEISLNRIVVERAYSPQDIMPVPSAAGAQDKPIAKIDQELLNLIDQYAERYYNDTWDLTLNQYKAWITTIAWSEGGEGSYTAHSQWAPGSDVFNHKVIGGEFRFSTGIGPFQIDRGGYGYDKYGPYGKWGTMPTIEKLNPEKSLLEVLTWHYKIKGFGKDTTLSDFQEQASIVWFGVKSTVIGTKWKEVTGTNWDDHKNGKASLDWQKIKNDISTVDHLYRYVESIDQARWDVTFATNTGKQVSFDGYNDTWLITARRDDGTTVMSYYYTYYYFNDKGTGCEVWVLNNSGKENEFRYIFVREYTTGPFPENVSGIVAGENTLEKPALDPTNLQTFWLSFPLPNRNTYDATINSVFDHSMNAPYIPNDEVIAYTGEKGEKTYGSDYVTTISGKELYGFKNSEGSNFVINGHYAGGGKPDYLYYDGHPGYDYRTNDQSPDGQINVLAAADGVAHLGSADYGTIYIDHGNGYRTYYVHLSQRNVKDNQIVKRGDVIGISGDTGCPGSPHLHFEVKKKLGTNWVPVDPYGWEDTGDDRYYKALGTNKNLWRIPAAKPLDVILDTDRSGSMAGQEIIDAQKAATLFVDLLKIQDRVGLVSFSSSATLDLHLTSDFEDAKNVIACYTAVGGTNMGDALNKSINELKTNGRDDAIWSIIYFTDGWTNTGLHKDQILSTLVPQAVDAGIIIYTLGYGSGADEDFLRQVAEATGGKYYFAPDSAKLMEVYIELSQKTKGMEKVAEFTGSVSPGETKTETFLLKLKTLFIRIFLIWPGSDLDLTLIDPNGTKIEPGMPGVIYSGNDTLPEYYEIYDPQLGNWTIEIYGKDVTGATEDYTVMIFQPGALMQVRPTKWDVNYPLNRTMIFNVSEIAGNLNLTNVTFTASDLTETVATSTVKSLMKSQAEAEEQGEKIATILSKVSTQSTHVIPTSVFSFTPNDFTVPAGESRDVNAVFTLPPDTPVGDYSGTIDVTSSDGKATIMVTLSVTYLPASIRIEPETLNLASEGVFTAFIQLPEGYDVADINISTVVCDEAPAIRGMVSEEDYGTYIAKFNRQDLLTVTLGDVVELTVTGKLYEGTPFEGSDMIRVID